MHGCTTAEFQARIWLDAESVRQIEVWVHELEPVDHRKRPLSEWVHEHLSDYDRDFFAEEFKLGEGSFQVLCRGTVSGWWSEDTPISASEWDEEANFTEFQTAQLPDDWDFGDDWFQEEMS